MDSIRDDAVFACAEEFFDCAEQQGASLPQRVRPAKNVAQAYLATREDTQMFPGIAAYRGYWPWDSAVFDELKLFLRSL